MNSSIILLCLLVTAVNSDLLLGLNKLRSRPTENQTPEVTDYNQTTTSTDETQNTQHAKSTDSTAESDAKLYSLEKQGPNGRTKESEELQHDKTDTLEHERTQRERTKNTHKKNKGSLNAGFLQFQDNESTQETDVSTDDVTREYQTDSEMRRDTVAQADGDASRIDSRTYKKNTKSLDETDVSEDTKTKTSTEEKKLGLGSIFSLDEKTIKTKKSNQTTMKKKHEDSTTTSEGEERYSENGDKRNSDKDYKSQSEANQDSQEESQSDTTETVKKTMNVDVLGMDIPIKTPEFKLPNKDALKNDDGGKPLVPITNLLGGITHLGNNKPTNKDSDQSKIHENCNSETPQTKTNKEENHDQNKNPISSITNILGGLPSFGKHKPENNRNCDQTDQVQDDQKKKTYTKQINDLKINPESNLQENCNKEKDENSKLQNEKTQNSKQKENCDRNKEQPKLQGHCDQKEAKFNFNCNHDKEHNCKILEPKRLEHNHARDRMVEPEFKGERHHGQKKHAFLGLGGLL